MYTGVFQMQVQYFNILRTELKMIKLTLMHLSVIQSHMIILQIFYMVISVCELQKQRS